MAAVAPAQMESRQEPVEYDVGASDVDAEGEEDVEIDYSMAHTPAVEIAAEGEQSDSDEPEEQGEPNDDGEEEEDEEDFVGAVKIPNGHAIDSDEEAGDEDGSEVNEDSVDEEDDDNSDKSSSSAESVAVEEWEGGSDGGEEAEAEVANRNNCM
jgi:hypothetical protein